MRSVVVSPALTISVFQNGRDIRVSLHLMGVRHRIAEIARYESSPYSHRIPSNATAKSATAALDAMGKVRNGCWSGERATL